MKALADKWHVYYLEGEYDFEEEEMTPDNTPWDELTLIVEPNNKEIQPGSTKVLLVQSEVGYAGWWTVPQQSQIADYNKLLPPESYKHFIRACFEEI